MGFNSGFKGLIFQHQFITIPTLTGIKRTGGEINHSPPSSVEIKNEWSYTSTPLYALMAWTGTILAYKLSPLSSLCVLFHPPLPLFLLFPFYLLPSFLLTFISFISIKPIPLQAWTGPDVSRRLRLPDFKTIGT